MKRAQQRFGWSCKLLPVLFLLIGWITSSLQGSPVISKRTVEKPQRENIDPDTLIYLDGRRVSESVENLREIGVIRLDEKISGGVRDVYLTDDASGRFSVREDSLLIVQNSDLLNYEESRSHRIVIGAVRVRDTLHQAYDIRVQDANDPPQNIILSNNEIPEHGRDSSFVGTFRVIDEDSADYHSLHLIEDAEGRFRLQERSLHVTDTVEFNHERKPFYNITVQTTDRAGAKLEKTVKIRILDRNDPPSAVKIHPSAVKESIEPGSLIGKLETIDEDSADTFTYRMSNQHLFTIKLRDSLIYLSKNARLDHETRPRLRFMVQSTDKGGKTVRDTVEMKVLDVNEPPTITSDKEMVMDEDQTSDFRVKVRDPETSAGNLALQLKSHNTDLLLPRDFEQINYGQRRVLRIRPRPDSNGVARVTAIVKDGQLSDSTTFRLQVRPVNDAPDLVRNVKKRLDEGARLLIRDRILRVMDIDNAPSELRYNIIDAPDHGKILLNDKPVDTAGFTQLDVRSDKVWYQHDSSEHHADTVRFNVRDGQGGLYRSITLPFGIVPINDPPVISEVQSQYILEDHSTNPLSFTIKDPETAGINLKVRGTSSNQELVPNRNVMIRGMDQIRTVQVKPAPNEYGETQITLTVSDGKDSASTDFKLSVEPVNDKPQISIPDTIKTKEDVTAGPIALRLFDQETSTKKLNLKIESTNERLVNREGIQIDGSGPDKQLYITPQKNKYGSSFLFFYLSDGLLTDTAYSYVKVKPVNDPPREFSLFNSELEQGFDSVSVSFNWEEAFDIDNNNITYLLHIEGSQLDTTIKGIKNRQYTFRTVDALQANSEYEWKVYATDGKDTTRSKATKQFLTPDLKNKPDEFKLYSNYPNPFNPVTNIKYKIPVLSRVTVSVYDMSGRMITQLVNKVQSPGQYEVSWNAGEQASGIYVCRITANSLSGQKQFVETRKMMLLK